jgi:3-dehydroquinate synthase
LAGVVQGKRLVFLTDTNVFGIYKTLFGNHAIIVVPAAEESKSLATIQHITEQLIDLEADRQTLLVGVGGGVITDITGLVASMYMRGISLGFVPTTLLGMVDASIGGKNGVNVGLYKNMLGTIRQPQFILFDKEFLGTLPQVEWSNGFAEIIKYGCVFDTFLFEELMDHDLQYYMDNIEALQSLIHRCVEWKNKVVMEDETERGQRKLLNFGHTVGHAIENRYGLPHGFAISIGMLIAARISEAYAGLNTEVQHLLRRTLQQYQLPTDLAYEPEGVMSILSLDKKRVNGGIDFVVLEQIGKAAIRKISFDQLSVALLNHTDAGDH